MKISSLENFPVQTPAVQLVQLSEPHGYRFDGDTVHLNARFTLLASAAHEFSWALQLWACSTKPASAQDLSGHTVAEVALPPIGEVVDEIQRFEASAFAWPPAGAGEHVMVLVLASGRPGQFNVIHDFAVYPCRQQFVQPCIHGNVDCQIDGPRACLAVARIENPRPEGNRSGTLSLELWAVSSAFTGGHFAGHHLAGVEIGSLSGQSEMALEPLELAFIPPPVGDWHIVLMLREWTSEGFVTRDFSNLGARTVSPPFLENAPGPVAEEISIPAPTEAAAHPSAGVPAAVAPKVVAPAAAPSPPPDAPTGCVSVNTARIEELRAVPGLSMKIAERIVKKRPFVSLDDLGRVKGMGAKLLAKVRSSLKL